MDVGIHKTGTDQMAGPVDPPQTGCLRQQRVQCPDRLNRTTAHDDRLMDAQHILGRQMKWGANKIEHVTGE